MIYIIACNYKFPVSEVEAKGLFVDYVMKMGGIFNLHDYTSSVNSRL
ncbi:hypothetical protein BH09BAC1_BH09BAC1_19620 [soil metagenome]